MSGKSPIPTRDPQVYEGANVVVPVGGWQYVKAKRDPSSNDKKYPVGTLWINTSTNTVFFQTSPTVWTNISGGAASFTSITTTGSITAGTTLTATAGAITATNGNLVLGTAGNKIISSSVASTTTAGANSFGTVTLVGGTATVSTTAVTASSIIFLTRQSIGSTGAAALGQLTVGTITASTSFVINSALTATATSLATTDVSVIGWMIVN